MRKIIIIALVFVTFMLAAGCTTHTSSSPVNNAAVNTAPTGSQGNSNSAEAPVKPAGTNNTESVPSTPRNPAPAAFCGKNLGTCTQDSDCSIQGQYHQVCSSLVLSTQGENLSCYNAQAYGVQCGCVSGYCQWYK